MVMADSLRFCLESQTIRVHRHPVPHVVIDGVFGEAGAALLLAELVSLHEHFVPAGIGLESEAAPFRQHGVFAADAYAHEEEPTQDFAEVLRKRSERLALLGAVDSLVMNPVLREVMAGAPFPLCKLGDVNRWETQVSRYGDGDHYGWHIDRIDSDARVLSMAYYLCESPSSFEGGALELSGGLALDGKQVAQGAGHGSEERCIEAVCDRLVIFSSRTVHRVRAIEAPADFGCGRFSVNIFCGVDGSPAGPHIY